jgi:hypothetical protein
MLFPPKFGAKPFQNGSRALRTAFQELKQDLKSTRWLRGFGWSAGVIWIFTLLGSAVFLGLGQNFGPPDTACQPDGSFRLNPESYSMWSSTGFFQITLGGGHLTFAEAKVVDIVWDIVKSSKELTRATRY